MIRHVLNKNANIYATFCAYKKTKPFFRFGVNKIITAKFSLLAVAFVVAQFSFGQHKDLSGVYLNHSKDGKTFEFVLKKICDTCYFFQTTEFGLDNGASYSFSSGVGILLTKEDTVGAYTAGFNIISVGENEIELVHIKSKNPYETIPPFMGRYKKTHDYNPNAFNFIPYERDTYDYYEAIEDWKYKSI